MGGICTSEFKVTAARNAVMNQGSANRRHFACPGSAFAEPIASVTKATTGASNATRASLTIVA